MSSFNIKVVCQYKDKAAEYCGRAGKLGKGSPLANPFWMKDEAARDDVCNRYEDWFKAKLDGGDVAVRNELVRLWKVGVASGELKLGCFCAPRRCHCDTIKSFFESKMV